MLRDMNNPTYRSYHAMLTRCYNPNSKDYPYYGARGIRVSKRWRRDYGAFLADMGTRPEGKTLDRRDPHGHYVPKNCRWRTPKQQNNNRTNHQMLTYKGRTRNVMQWAEQLGISYQTIYWRLKQGWPIEQVLSVKRHYTPRSKSRERLTVGRL